MTNDPLLKVTGLRTHFSSEHGTVKAVDGVDFQIERGGILGVVGESGSGKSVTGLSILRLLGSRNATIAGGQILFHGEDLLTKSDREMREIRGKKISMVFQNAMTALDPFFRVGDQLVEVIRLHQRVGKREAKLKALEAMELVRIPEASRRLSSYPHQLSGGQRQRVMIAMALAGNPELVIADEPTTALDVTIQAQILELIHRLRDEAGCAFVLVSHNLSLAARIADRVAVLYAGRVAEIGGAADILARPEHPYTAALLSSRLTLDFPRDAQVPTLAGEPPDPRRLPPGCPFEPRCEFARPECAAALPELDSRRGGEGGVACIRHDQIELSAAPAGGGDRAPLGAGARTESPPEGTDGPVVTLDGVNKTFRLGRGFKRGARLQALRDVSLSVNPGECLAVVG
ncbi:MAG TPA: oligopeptide/dipeptide ABC transporter ATP-binding protein, partial [Pseudonocardia sp.]|uniref:ABC transporter ATP-binding protein n=1 Tax=Pseudonocardia sp. TaxID=60912 RepID=UPI002C56DB5A